MEKAKLETLLVSCDITLKGAMQKLNETDNKILFVVDDNQNIRRNSY